MTMGLQMAVWWYLNVTHPMLVEWQRKWLP